MTTSPNTATGPDAPARPSVDAGLSAVADRGGAAGPSGVVDPSAAALAIGAAAVPKTVGVVGGGRMGAGIAQVFAALDRVAMGLLRSTDLVGLDVRLAIAEHLSRELGERFEPPQLLRDKVARGELGRKSGQGFYTWDDGR